MADNQITYDDLLKPTDSITKAIAEYTQLITTYTDASDKIKKDAKELTESVNKVSGASKKQRDTLTEAEKQTQKLENAQKLYNKSLGNAEKELVKLKEKQKEQNQINRLTVKLNKSQEGSYNKLSAQYSLNKIRLNQMSDQQRETTRTGQELERQTKEIYEEMNRLQKATGKSQLQVGRYEKIFSGIAGGFNKVFGALGIAGGVGLLSNAIKDGIGITKEYEKANAELAGVLGVTYSGTEKLRNESKRLGEATPFSAKQVTMLQLELARLGKTENEIIDSTEGIINATVALGSETGATAALVGSTLSSFNMNASESTKVADILTLSTQKSALSFEKLNTSLPIASAAASAAGVDLETLVAQLGKAADNGIDASTAATSLRNIYIKLAEKGITLDQAMVKINTSQDKLTTAVELFDKRSAVTALSLANNANATKKLDNELRKAGGTAQRVANVQLDTLDGKLKLLNSAWEGFVLNIFDSNGGIVKFIKGVVEATTSILSFINSLDGSNREMDRALKVTNELYEKYGDVESILGNVNIVRQELIEQLQQEGYGYDEAKQKAEDYLKTMELISEGFVDEFRISMLKNEVEMLEKLGGNTDAVLNKKKELQELEDKLVYSKINLLKATDEELQKYLELQNSYFEISDVKKRFIDDVNAEILRRKELILELGDEEVKLIDLIKAKQDERREIQDTIAVTEKDVEFRNIRLKQIDKEIDRLRKLGEEYDKIKPLEFKIDDKKFKKDFEKLEKETRNFVKNYKKEIPEQEGVSKMFVLSEDQKDAVDTTKQYMLQTISEIQNARVESANIAVANSQKEIESIQSRLDNEIATRNAGYAANVEGVQRELTLAKATQEKALQQQREAQNAELQLQSVMQAGDLITASAKIWAQLGFPFAIPALGVMWGSFIGAKIKASQITKPKTYGDGGIEFLGGGTHASGNDTTIGFNNGYEIKGERNEAIAVINAKNTSKYRGVLPSIVESLNKGVFEDYYGGSQGSVVNLDMQDMPKNMRKMANSEKEYIDGRGRRIVKYKNVKTIYNV